MQDKSTKANYPKTIITYPNPILEAKSQDVIFPLNQKTLDIINTMWSSVKTHGVGIAASQVGYNLNMFIVNLSEDPEEKRKLKIPDFLVINPKIIFYSEVQNYMIEGCLSFPDQYGYVKRPANIAVEYFDQNGKKQLLKCKGMLSRVIQHEYDHLLGKIFIKNPTYKALSLEDLVM
jgi:peptide deformylase